jgi:hypothetical protein
VIRRQPILWRGRHQEGLERIPGAEAFGFCHGPVYRQSPLLRLGFGGLSSVY